jgi:hypothetical protein
LGQLGQVASNLKSNNQVVFNRRLTVNECYPLYLGNRKGIDMRDDYGFEEQVKALVKDIVDN